MGRVFNTAGDCKPELHYMVDLSSRLARITRMIEQGDYFTINRGRQYGKTTTLRTLAAHLRDRYLVVSLDFQNLDASDFSSVENFVEAFAAEFYDAVKRTPFLPQELLKKIREFADGEITKANLRKLFSVLRECCECAALPIVLLIDEVDTASNNQVFLDFLAQLRAGYINRDVTPTFQSVILAGVYDIKNLKRKFVSDSDHKMNSPWNISASFDVDMSFSAAEIAGMLNEYEADYHTEMDTDEIAALLYEYTSGYPVLVSGLCKLLDEEIVGSEGFPNRSVTWTYAGVTEAVKYILRKPTPLFESMIKQIVSNPELKEMLKKILFEGEKLTYNPYNEVLSLAVMFGYIKSENNQVAVANRIFEMLLYNYFLSEEEMESVSYKEAQESKNQFIKNGKLDMDSLIRSFVQHFTFVYADNNDQKFIEKYGRKIFLLYLKPIINGTGNYYIEAQTRDAKRTDVIVDYKGQIFLVELKIWHGQKYNESGEKQLIEYLDRYHLKKGYLLTFSFNKKKQTGVKQLLVGDRILVEAVV